MSELLSLDFMRQALVAAVLVGLAAPLVGAFLVQRRMSLIGDGIGHVALAGVAVGILTGSMPVVTALLAAVAAAVAVEVIRATGRTSGDIALAVMFYGGIALGVVLISRSSATTPANLTAYLFGAILTTSRSDIVVFAGLATVVVTVTLVLRQRFFAVASDEEYATAVGLPVRGYNVALSVLTAVTVVVSMRVVGLLLITALMIIPNASAQLVSRSFRSSLAWASLIGLASSVSGVVLSFYAETPSGGTIVLIAIGVFLALSLASALARRVRRASHARAERHDHEHGPRCGHLAIAHDGHVDYLHDGHRHAAHDDHWDDHGDAGRDDHRHGDDRQLGDDHRHGDDEARGRHTVDDERTEEATR
ncbi:zinc transport system permease protein [Knoellia remsis]|uniref:Zinc transport system permease protein n=1 Tax=Knoellia remsis TaxID=407159 RepID=A0A2T0V0P9_9MICO|nr:metal ABC transporter permease [Knoellia remsis]PRY63724.1 zinc transport system permease protein [Knoellia remsis]